MLFISYAVFLSLKNRDNVDNWYWQFVYSTIIVWDGSVECGIMTSRRHIV